jgi:hypothetical protein
MLERGQVAHLNPRVEVAVCQAPDTNFDKWQRQRHFVEAFCRLTTSDQTYLGIGSARLGRSRGWGVPNRCDKRSSL